MDKYRIIFQCHTAPESIPGLEGYEIQKQYVGRMFNGLFEISPSWGSDKQTKLIAKALFDEYFEIVKNNSNF